MLLSALLLATTVQAMPPSPIVKPCAASPLEYTARRTPSKVQRLGDLPPANHTLTVLRSVDGCPVSSTVRYNVDRPAGG